MDNDALPGWVRNLDEEELHFIRRMVLASGSLKALATEYGVSYPTIRQRLDRIIERLALFEKHKNDDPFEARLRVLVAEGRVDARLGRELMKLHKTREE